MGVFLCPLLCAGSNKEVLIKNYNNVSFIFLIGDTFLFYDYWETIGAVEAIWSLRYGK